MVSLGIYYLFPFFLFLFLIDIKSIGATWKEERRVHS
jgi:hypothetical protein